MRKGIWAIGIAILVLGAWAVGTVAAQESADFGHGVFTYYLLEGLRGAAGVKGEDDLSLLDVYNYIWPKVKQATKGLQVPQLKGDLAGQILIGRSAVHGRR